MNYLYVVAHPDDECLGAGATINKLSDNNNVYVAILSSKVNARHLRPKDECLKEDINKAMMTLKVKQVIYGNFPNIKLNNVDHIDLVQFIESAILDANADVIITHHPADTNNDHLHVSLACQAAIRLFQRKKHVKAIKEFLYMEVLSSTEWSTNSAMNKFNPNTFVEVGIERIETKIKALSMYRDVIRDYPHPRSEEAIKGLAAYRGAQSGCKYAEAFEMVFRRE